MNIVKKLFICSFALFLLSPVSFAYGQVTSSVNTESDQKAIIVADVNIKDAKITSQTDSTIALSFTMTNGAGVQSGVRYAVELLSKQKEGYVTVDRKVYDEALTLLENTKISRDIVYTAPTSVDDVYEMRITSGTVNGIPLAGATLGEVTFKKNGVGGIYISPKSCTLTAAGNQREKKTTLIQGAALMNSQTLRLDCSVTNSFTTPITAAPRIETTHRSVFGERVEIAGGDTAPIAFAANETKTISLTLPTADKPQVYSVTIALVTKDGVSNVVSSQYKILGVSASVENATLDADFYKKGATAKLSILWQSTIRTAPLSIESIIKNDKGVACTAPVTTSATLQDLDPLEVVALPITRACFNPRIQVIIKDANNTVLDDKTFAFETVSVKRPASMWPFVVAGIIIIGAGGVFLLKKRKSTVVAATETN